MESRFPCDIDVNRHNEEISKLWAAFWRGRAARVPIVFGMNPRFLLLDPKRNPFPEVNFEDYFRSPSTMMEIQLAFQSWVRHNVLMDQELGLPSDGWKLWVDFQNIYEAAWVGCPIVYRAMQVPDTQPILTDEGKLRQFLQGGLPSPTQNLMDENLRIYQFFKGKQAEGFEYEGRPIAHVEASSLGTDGMFTLACSLRGPEGFCLDLKLRPGLAHELLSLLTEAIIARIRFLRAHVGWTPGPSILLADDSIQLLSLEDYVNFVLPCHRRYFEALGKAGQRRSIHLCGDATRHFPVIQSELGATEFDTGFPVDFASVRAQLGEETFIWGGPDVDLLLRRSPTEVEQRTAEILQSGVKRGRRFVLREGNNLSPGTPMANMLAMYRTGRRWGAFLD